MWKDLYGLPALLQGLSVLVFHSLCFSKSNIQYVYALRLMLSLFVEYETCIVSQKQDHTMSFVWIEGRVVVKEFWVMFRSVDISNA